MSVYEGLIRGRPVGKKELDVEEDGQEKAVDDGFRAVEEQTGGEGEDMGME